MTKYCLLTNDVETHSIWFNTLRDATGEKVLKEGMPLLLSVYEKYNIRSTFYFVGNMAEKFPEVVRMIVPYGHEVASHGWTHEVDEAFDVLPFDKQKDHLIRSKKILEDISGKEVKSFRAPALRINEHTPRALIEAGYNCDSSVAAQRFDMFLSFGGRKKLNWLGAPRLPYRTSPDNLFKKGDGPLIEIPLTAMLFPFVGTTLRIFPAITKMQQRLFNAETASTGKPLVFDIHPNEMIDESAERRTIARRTKNPIKYLLSDVIRGKMKVKNLGPQAAVLYDDFISYYKRQGYEFITVNDYVKRHFPGA